MSRDDDGVNHAGRQKLFGPAEGPIRFQLELPDHRTGDRELVRADGFYQPAEFAEYLYVSKNIKAVNGSYVSEAAEKKRQAEKQMELYESGE